MDDAWDGGGKVTHRVSVTLHSPALPRPPAEEEPSLPTPFPFSKRDYNLRKSWMTIEVWIILKFALLKYRFPGPPLETDLISIHFNSIQYISG